MHQALYWKKVKEKVQCQLCPHFCTLGEGERGKCHVRLNKGGELQTLVYGYPVSMHVDPIEKKPLFHFFPGEGILSYGTAGCNLSCQHCQNWEISQAEPEEFSVPFVEPEKIIEMAKKQGIRMIAATYNEPTIDFEYMFEVAQLAREKGIKNVMVSSGFINPEPLKQLCGVLDAANIDLKAFNEDFYKKVCGARLQPVLKSLEYLHAQGVWLEITTLLIPGLNDSPEEIEKLSAWISEHLSKEVPLHFSRFFPHHEMLDKKATPPETLLRAKRIAEKYLDYVYVGNLMTDTEENTYCTGCKKVLVERRWHSSRNFLDGDKCRGCGKKVAGRFHFS